MCSIFWVLSNGPTNPLWCIFYVHTTNAIVIFGRILLSEIMESIEQYDANRDELIIQQQREIEKEVRTAMSPNA